MLFKPVNILKQNILGSERLMMCVVVITKHDGAQ